MALFHSRRVTPEKVVVFLMVGFGIGTAVGYIFMATAHTVRPVQLYPHDAGTSSRGPAHLLEAPSSL